MQIGILGSGAMGGKLGTIFARAGHEVIFSYSRNEHKLERLARDAGAAARAGTPRQAAVVSASCSAPSGVLSGVFEARDSGRRPSLVYCGDDAEAKKPAARLIGDAGFDPVDAGPLRIARYIEPFTMLIGPLAYETEGGPALAYRFERFEEPT
jgi:predicted dinucleotide-binding enzyme